MERMSLNELFEQLDLGGWTRNEVLSYLISELDFTGQDAIAAVNAHERAQREEVA